MCIRDSDDRGALRAGRGRRPLPPPSRGARGTLSELRNNQSGTTNVTVVTRFSPGRGTGANGGNGVHLETRNPDRGREATRRRRQTSRNLNRRPESSERHTARLLIRAIRAAGPVDRFSRHVSPRSRQRRIHPRPWRNSRFKLAALRTGLGRAKLRMVRGGRTRLHGTSLVRKYRTEYRHETRAMRPRVFTRLRRATLGSSENPSANHPFLPLAFTRPPGAA
jgi:hypothetical protein